MAVLCVGGVGGSAHCQTSGLAEHGQCDRLCAEVHLEPSGGAVVVPGNRAGHAAEGGGGGSGAEREEAARHQSGGETKFNYREFKNSDVAEIK